MRRLFAIVAALFFIGSASADSDDFLKFEFEQIADGVWAGVRPDSPRFPVLGNTTFVIGDTGVVVFDGGGLPVMGEQIIDKVASLTSLPVTHVVISHWHGDHHFGIAPFLKRFPNVQVVAHSFTERAMRGSTIDYIENYAVFDQVRLPGFRQTVETGVHPDGNPATEHDLEVYRQILRDEDIYMPEFRRVTLTLPNLVFDGHLTIRSGDRTIELMSLGAGNTEGDIVMWLPDEKIVSTGDLVVLPSPYAFNMPPRAWADTLRRLNELEYRTLVPGHGPVQRDRAYVDLLIDVGDDIANQRDALAANGVATENIAEQLDFSAWKDQFTHGDAYIEGYYTDWFEVPFREAAVKELSGDPMVEIGPRKQAARQPD